MPRPWAAACRLLTLAWLPTPTPLTLPTLPLPTLTTMLLLLLMPCRCCCCCCCFRCDAGLLFKHASVPQVVSSVKAEYPPVGNYHFNKSVPALKEHKNNAHTLLLALSYLRSQPGRPRARHGELTPRWPRVRELPLPLLLGLEERR